MWRRAFVTLLWIYSTAGPVSETLTTNRQFYVEGADSVAVGSVTTTYAAVNIGVPVIAVAIVVAVAFFKRINLIPIGVVALPSLTLSALQFISGRELSAALFVPALIGAGVIALGIRLDDLAVIGYLGGAVAVVSMIGMVVAPQSVLMSAGLAQAEKSLTGEPLLAGIFSHSNILGMFLGLSLPFAFLVKRWVISAMLVVAVCCALILTSSRTAVSGALIVLAVALLGWILPRAPWRIIGAFGFVAVVSALFVVPFSETDPTAYTYRGQIWMYNIDQWSQDRLFGLGADWYRDNYRELREVLSSAASHAHNEALTLLVQGGAVLLVAVGVLVASAWKGAAQQERRREGITAVSFVLGFLLMSVTETTFPILNWGPTSTVALVPLFVLAADAWGGRNVGPASGARLAEGEDGVATWRQWVN